MKCYKVAGHVFVVKASDGCSADIYSLMDNYAPFEIAGDDDAMTRVSKDAVFALEIQDFSEVDFVEETRQDDEGQEIICGRTSGGLPVFEFYLGKVKAGTLLCEENFRNARLLLDLQQSAPHLQKFALNNSLMVLYALATACFDTALFHSAVVTRSELGYMFLGKSGTGKSTHARMWLRRFDDAELLNDDNPVVRIEPDGVWVYGSPWSGKTPCYKNRRAKLAGIIDLSQAPQNRIRPIQGLDAYMALLGSISGMRWDKRVADGLHATENGLAQKVRMFHLDCLPDVNAAEVCYGAF